jgi:hypothetical protein
MNKLRAYLVALTILATAASPLLAQSIGIRTTGNPLAFAAVVAGPFNENEDDDGNNNNNNSNSNSNNSNLNSNNNNSNSNSNTNNDNGGDNDEDNSDNGNSNSNSNSNSNDNGASGGGGDQFNPPAQTAAPAPACSTPGQEMTFQSGDGRVAVKVFPSLNQAVKFSIRLPVDPASVPPPPGPAVGGLLFQLIAESCDGNPIPTLPAEINLGVHYSDADAAGANEGNITLARLDTSANQWRQVQKQAPDPASNLTSATITEMGFYVLYQR